MDRRAVQRAVGSSAHSQVIGGRLRSQCNHAGRTAHAAANRVLAIVGGMASVLVRVALARVTEECRQLSPLPARGQATRRGECEEVAEDQPDLTEVRY